MTAPRAWLRRYTGSVDRSLLLANLIVRAAAAALILAGTIGTARLFGPGLPLLLGAGLLAESALLAALWLRAGHVPQWTLLAVDLPAYCLAIVLGALLTPSTYFGTLANYAYVVAMLTTLALGATVRRLAVALPAALTYAVAFWAGTRLAGQPYSLGIATFNVINPLVGWACASQLRRAAGELARAQRDAVAGAVALVTQRERARQARALHDRVLQTLETLGRPGWIADPELAATVAAQAAWLRAFVETGEPEREDLSSGLEAAARAAAAAGLRVELNDAGLRLGPATPALPEAGRDALLDATYQVLDALAGHAGHVVVRAAPAAGGIQVSVLATSRARPPDPDALGQAGARIAEAGGTLLSEPVPYVELWVPTDP
jgi:hypothetical protein